MKTKLLLIFIATTLAAFCLWWVFLKQNSASSTYPQNHADRRNKLLYTCPMHPQIRSDKPGSCPICGMDLVLMETLQQSGQTPPTEPRSEFNQEASKRNNPSLPQAETNSAATFPEDHGEFHLTLNKQQMIGVKIEKAKKKSLFKAIRAPGRVAFDPELYTAQSEYLEALKQWNHVKNSPLSGVRENTNQMIRSSKIRLKVLGLSEDQIASLAKKGSQSEGLLVSGKGQESWIYADIFEVDLPYIEKGLSAKITANFLQGKTLAGKVISVDQVINRNSRTAKVRIQLLENHSSIRPESYVNITIFAPVGEHIAVPLEAILDTGRETFVFVKKKDGDFEPRKVVVLLETDREAAIASGVLPGEDVVAGGNFMLDSESRLKAVIQKANNRQNDHNH